MSWTSGNTAPLVTGRDLSVRRQGRWILEGVDIDISPGEIVTIIGPNGAGKSTLAKVVLGLIAADRGGVERRSELTVGYVPQRIAVDASLPMTVERLMRLTRPTGAQAIEAALAETGVAHLAKAPVQRLSGGEFQRVMLARALVAQPQLLVLDEPVQNVDVAGAEALYALIAGIRDRHGCGVLLISHDLNVVMATADKVLFLHTHLCCSGTPEEVANHHHYISLFGPRPLHPHGAGQSAA